MLWSPTYVLATQIGNSFEISHILASFLIGFGFQAYVVCGYVDESVSKMNRTEEKCPFLTKDEEKKEKGLDDEQINISVDMDALDINSLENIILSPSASFGNLSNNPKLLEFPQNIVENESTKPNNVFHEDMLC